MRVPILVTALSVALVLPLLQPTSAEPVVDLRLALADFEPPGTPGIQAISTIATGVTAFDLAKAMEGTPGIVKGAQFVSGPPLNWYYGVSDSPLTTFPSVGNTFAILSTGNATYASQPNTSGSTSSDNAGGNVRGNTDYDVVILMVDLVAPTGHTVNCLSVEFRFLSEEYPEWVGSIFNDAAVGEPGLTNWNTQDSVVFSPNNFMFTDPNQLVSINGAGQFHMSATAATGTTYDGATPHYVSTTPVPPPTIDSNGTAHYIVYFSIFDQGDHIYDSTIFLDNLQLFAGATCVRGPAGIVAP